MKKLSIIAIILSSIAILGEIILMVNSNSKSPASCLTNEVASKQMVQSLKNKGNSNETKELPRMMATVMAPTIPDSMDFCGERVPLELYYVRESLDRELIVNTYGHSSTLLYFKRANRYFPIIEPILKRNGVPEDFKYLCVIESSLTNATSPAKAQGFWQFMKTTGESYGLEVTTEIDMRNDLEASTEAACKFLKKLHNDLGSWTAAAAAYNCGGGGMSSNMTKQGVKSYYNTRLNAETTRYIYRILAVKQIMQHPQEYGFYIRQCDLYPEIPYRTATLEGQNVDLYAFAKANNTSYKMLREMNPWLITDKLTNRANKKYTVKLPAEKGLKLRDILKDKDKSKEFVKSM
ncbi:MAG: transglycosylase SLT domain-containing protein [Bacteroidales bacterium]|nr:transglycosylase SLT domain-containing protein [Bacteroidales bacterium]